MCGTLCLANFHIVYTVGGPSTDVLGGPLIGRDRSTRFQPSLQQITTHNQHAIKM